MQKGPRIADAQPCLYSGWTRLFDPYDSKVLLRCQGRPPGNGGQPHLIGTERGDPAAAMWHACRARGFRAQAILATPNAFTLPGNAGWTLAGSRARVVRQGEVAGGAFDELVDG